MAFGVRIDGSDLRVTTTADAGEAADATRMRDDLHRQLESFKSMLPMLGVPATLGSKLAFVTEGDLLSLDLTITSDELRSVRETVGRM